MAGGEEGVRCIVLNLEGESAAEIKLKIDEFPPPFSISRITFAWIKFDLIIVKAREVQVKTQTNITRHALHQVLVGAGSRGDARPAGTRRG